MSITIPLRVVIAILLACLIVGLVYPFILWLFLDVGLVLGLGLGRVYALWAGMLLFGLTIGGMTYLLKEGK